jgi:hypothetical protein
MNRLFIVTVASEKGGVGKTTIATNLAVYLKALHEDLPVTIASFDNHFSIDHMFALGPRPTVGMAELLGDAPSAGLVTLGQYGVQYLASARRLAPPARPPSWLRGRLESLGLEGVLILDTRPILDWFTEAALLAADLVLTPVKDRAALVNAATLRAVLLRADRAGRLWLVPSLVDARARLNGEVRVSDLLIFAARERDYQVTDLVISKSPRVEGLASGFSNRILPVLTHARQTAVHGQLRALAEFALAQRAAAPQAHANVGEGSALARRRCVEWCPVCAGRATDNPGHAFFDLRSRRRGALHPDCFRAMLRGGEFDRPADADSLLVLELFGPGLVDEAAQLQLHLFDHADRPVTSWQVDDPLATPFKTAIEGMTGRGWLEQRREWLLLAGTPQTDLRAWTSPVESRRRRNLLRSLLAR